MTNRDWNRRDAALLVDLYELTMAQAYWREGMTGEAVFDLYFRSLPERRNFVVACGVADVLGYLSDLRFRDEHLDYLRGLGQFTDPFLDALADFRFTGSVRAMPEGTPVFPEEPLLEVRGPILEAQLVESLVMNQVCFQSVLASKAARVVTAAGGRTVVDFGLRRMHGIDAGLKAARAFHVAGVSATSNVLAGRIYGVPVTGTMAHAYIQAHDDEFEAFRRFAELYPETVLLVDTYDTLEGVEKVVRLAETLGDDFRVRAIRLDSGDLGQLAKESRRILDGAGLDEVEIFASGGLDEDEIHRLVEDGAPIDGFGVGTRMGVSDDAPSLDMAYKLVSYDGTGRLKTSPGKRILPGPKQVYRVEKDDVARHDVLATADEEVEGRPLLVEMMRDGEILDCETVDDEALDHDVFDLEAARKRCAREIDRLPARLRALDPAKPAYDVEVTPTLRERYERARRRAETNDDPESP